MQTIFLLIFLSPLILFTVVAQQMNSSVIPKVHHSEVLEGNLYLNRSLLVHTNSNQLAFELEYCEKILREHNNKTEVKTLLPPLPMHLIVEKITSPSLEAYEISIRSTGVTIKANTSTGIFRGICTFQQMLTVDGMQSKSIPCQYIRDEPKFSWRGTHLDVSRHFFNKDFIKKYLDILAFYKINVFHWHLTDDQGWRIEIKRYPKLTEIGSLRAGTMVGPYANQNYDSIPYGGFYTQEEIREIVAYAKERHITIVPEIEMPGHALAALASYPEYSCSGGPHQVARGWGVFDDVFCTKPETLEFLKHILDEVIELFPSAYIHIGGDECPKTRWKSCAHCQKTIRENKLKNEEQLQSYFIQEIERHLNGKGRKIIGWDEILEGGLAQNAAVMSWRGTQGAIEAARSGHYTVLSPGSHCYFDHYQGNPKAEPLAFGGYTTLEKVYNFQPIPEDLESQFHPFVLGGQANLWTEYMTTTKQVEYMLLPRLLALSEVLWGSADPNHYLSFVDRVLNHFKNILAPKGYHYAKSIFEVNLETTAENGKLYANLSSPLVKNLFYGFSPDGILPNQEKIEIAAPCTLVYGHFFDGKIIDSLMYRQDFTVNLATAKSIEFKTEPHASYAHNFKTALINGIKASKDYLGKDWIGFSGEDLNLTINLQALRKISEIKIGFLSRNASWVYLPSHVEIWTSKDGVHFSKLASLDGVEIQDDLQIPLNKKDKIESQYLRIFAKNLGKIPENMPGAGNKAWLFVDEIEVY